MLPPIKFDAKALTKPVTKLIESVAKGAGNLWEPHGIIRRAKAEAQAAIIRTEGEIEVERLHRAATRIAYLEDRRQGVIEAVVEEAKGYLPATVSDEPVSEDWMVHFFENCKDVGEAEMRTLWAKILAEQVAVPGKFSRRTLQALKTFDKLEAEAFTVYCSASFINEKGWHFTVSSNATAAVLQQSGVEAHLVSVGLLQAEPNIIGAPKCDMAITYFGESYRFVAPPPEPTSPSGIELLEAPVFFRGFTIVGEQLARVVNASPIAGFIENLSKELEAEAQVRIVRS